MKQHELSQLLKRNRDPVKEHFPPQHCWKVLQQSLSGGYDKGIFQNTLLACIKLNTSEIHTLGRKRLLWNQANLQWQIH